MVRCEEIPFLMVLDDQREGLLKLRSLYLAVINFLEALLSFLVQKVLDLLPLFFCAPEKHVDVSLNLSKVIVVLLRLLKVNFLLV